MQDLAYLLSEKGYKVETLTGANATKALILDGARYLADVSRRGDSAVFTFSGHGTYVRDADGDEADGYDEAICPADYRNGLITDDDLFEVFRRRKVGVRLVMVSDSCHSGTMSRQLPGQPPPHAPRIRFLPPQQALGDRHPLRPRLHTAPGTRPTVRTAKAMLETGALVLSGCSPSEYSYDAWFETGGRWRANGALTRAVLDIVAEQPGLKTFKQLHGAVRKRLPTSSYPQTPELNGTRTQQGWRLW